MGRINWLKIGKMLLTCACIAMTFFAISGRTSRVSAGEKIIVGVPDDRCPVFYLDDETGEITGIGVDLMIAASENAGLLFLQTNSCGAV